MSATQSCITERAFCEWSWRRLWCRSCESACLPPMWPRSKPGPSVISALRFRVFSSRPCSEEIFSGFSSFPLSTKINIAKFQLDRDLSYSFNQLTIWYELFLFFSLKIFAKWHEINLSNRKCYDKDAHTLNDVYNQSHSKCEIHLACINGPRNRIFEACISILIRKCFQRCLNLAYANLWRKKIIRLFYKHVATY